MIRIVASARRDLDEGFQLYELQERGLGDYFVDETRPGFEIISNKRSEPAGGANDEEPVAVPIQCTWRAPRHGSP
jgi:hypothetical protein